MQERAETQVALALFDLAGRLFYRRPGLAVEASQRHAAAFDQRLHATAREVRQGGRQRTVEAFAGHVATGNPPELGVLEAGVARVPGARCVTIPTGPQTYGHYTTMRAAVWRPHLAEFLAGLPKR